ncbi:hypothetical protein BDZ97DRAFT_1786963 [Flammula alnicola]|nr:hypothetical protein BDZ97DRAFT_1786963 [Flammula alnicola]
MAQTTQDTALFSGSTGKEVKEQAAESEGGGIEVSGSKHVDESSSSTPSVAITDPHAEKTSSTASTDAQPNAPSSRPSLVPLGSSHTQSTTLTPVAPHPKRFSAVNINKKFLEKNTVSGSPATSSNSSAAKSGSPAARPSVQPTSSHSRLVTAKLTANPVVASSTAGWSRPSSVAPSPATTSSPISTSPLPTAPATQPSTTAAPQLPHAGKVILPQPRAAVVQMTSSQKESGGAKPVWGNVKPPAVAPTRPDIQPDDFPTAAEVANNVASSVRKQVRADEAKTASDTSAKQLRLEEADTFRGVHLDPNAHHWDEMEEDDDNFLGGVIEFGDGRQYKIESNEKQGGASPPRSGSMPRPPAGEGALKESVSSPSRNSPASVSREFPPSTAPQSASPNVSPVISHAVHSPQDSSRVLFNERSNRLEPYNQSHRPGQGPFGSKRPSHQDGPGFAEPRSAREGSHNFQVLQKPAAGDFGSRSRRFSGSSGHFNAGHANGFIGDRNRERDQLGRRDGPPPSPRMSRDLPPHTVDAGGWDRDFNNDRGRRSAMGPPPVPSHAMQEGGRQLPPHLSQVSPNIPTRRLPSRDSRFSPSETSAGLPPSTPGRLPPHSPAISHSSLSLVSPVTGANIALPLSAPELDEVRKDVMHSAAERAKQRRQQEEAEREAQKERARHKAVELEEKIKAAEAEKQKETEALEAAKLAKEKEAISLIEEAVKSVELTAKPADEKRADSKPQTRIPPPLKPVSTQPIPEPLRSSAPKRTATIPPRTAPLSAPITPASQTESWRARTNPPPTPRQTQTRQPASANFIASGPSAAEQIETIADGSKDDLEVVDFSDMGKFVGHTTADTTATPGKTPEVSSATSILPRGPRPVAADFFDEPTTIEGPVSASKKAEFGAWRRKVSQDADEPPVPPPASDVKVEVANDATKVSASSKSVTSPQDRITPTKEQSPIPEAYFTPDTSMISTKEPLSHLEQVHGGQIIHVSPSSNSQRTPRSQSFYKEAAMSALDDAMSRIKGVLVGMHAHEPPKAISPSSSVEQEVQPSRTVQIGQPPQTPSRFAPKDRWVPPALRPRRFDDHDEPREVFLVTAHQPPPSPTNGTVSVKLPSISRPVEIVNKRQLYAFSRPPFQARMDILSFDPPVYDMRRDLSLNDVLFRKLPAGKFRYRVVIPRQRGPKVSIPNATLAKPNGTGAFGRPTVADGATTWRKAVVSPTAKADFVDDVAGLNTMSRSPPPNHTPPESTVASIPKSSDSSPAKSDSYPSVRSRSQPKMPEGSAVAFIRDSRIDVVEADSKPLVNFIVGSQLEESKPSPRLKASDITSVPPPVGPTFNGLDRKDDTNAHALNGVASTISAAFDDKEHAPIFASIKAESKSSDDSTDQILVTPPTHHSSASWARSSVSLTIKDSPARAPDPEHLKAVWSQTSNKAGLHAVNSLEGIADDLTALPFTLQDVKSEDGETPPPSLPSAPSRMSLHDVTRAFQTVPTSSSTSSQPPHRATFSPPSTQAPVARPTTAPYAYSPAPQSNMRPAYVTYPSPMMSPAPVMYGLPMASSPVPSRMQVNGHTPLYSQPMWMTMPGPSQTHGSLMRPVPSPYPAQMMAYPSPGYAPQPPPNMMPTTPQGQNGGRGRGMQIMSPVMSHAHTHPGSAMYGGSPVMLHAVQVPQNHGYIPMPAGRGQPRTENGQLLSQQQHPPHNVHHPQSQGGFNPGPTSSFVRSAW